MDSRPRVGMKKFGQLWNVLFPKCLIRHQKDIPGTCNTCYLIDEGRKTSEDAAVLQHFKMSHVLHRGGNFMLERDQ